MGPLYRLYEAVKFSEGPSVRQEYLVRLKGALGVEQNEIGAFPLLLLMNVIAILFRSWIGFGYTRSAYCLNTATAVSRAFSMRFGK